MTSGARYEFEPDHPLYLIERRLVGPNRRVLEFGCAGGHMTRALVEQGCRVVGLEMDPELAAQAAPHAEDVLVVDLERDDFVEKLRGQEFDVALFGDVLEHLRDPARVLADARRLLAPEGYVVVSVPNVAHVDVRLSLLRGDFPYGDYGLLDRTHVRFFTRAALDELFGDAGYVPVEIDRHTIEPFLTELAPSRDVPSGVLELALADPESTTYQFIVKAVPDNGDPELHALAARYRALDDESHARSVARVGELAATRAELDALRSTRLFRSTGWLRGLYGRLRRS